MTKKELQARIKQLEGELAVAKSQLKAANIVFKGYKPKRIKTTLKKRVSPYYGGPKGISVAMRKRISFFTGEFIEGMGPDLKDAFKVLIGKTNLKGRKVGLEQLSQISKKLGLDKLIVNQWNIKREEFYIPPRKREFLGTTEKYWDAFNYLRFQGKREIAKIGAINTYVTQKIKHMVFRKLIRTRGTSQYRIAKDIKLKMEKSGLSRYKFLKKMEHNTLTGMVIRYDYFWNRIFGDPKYIEKWAPYVSEVNGILVRDDGLNTPLTEEELKILGEFSNEMDKDGPFAKDALELEKELKKTGQW